LILSGYNVIAKCEKTLKVVYSKTWIFKTG